MHFIRLLYSVLLSISYKKLKNYNIATAPYPKGLSCVVCNGRCFLCLWCRDGAYNTSKQPF